MNKVKRDLDELMGSDSRFTESMKRHVIWEVGKEENPRSSVRRSFNRVRNIAVFVLLLSFAGLFLFLVLNEEGSRESLQPAEPQQELAPLTDDNTTEEIETFTNITGPYEVFEYRYDAMDRGNREYYKWPLVIDPTAYDSKDVSRGDVVLYEDNSGKNVSRIVGLPGETVEISDGQVYVNGRMVDTFYGQAHRVGTSTTEEYLEWFEDNTSSLSSTSGMEEVFQLDMEEVQLEENQFFIIGDDWFRGNQEVIELRDITGEVLGYLKE
ncbi:signal peptidase I [Planococcus lenghuensis]|uniref:Signal peptidase I n=1 Tax=Planococcus lenghuensis TaxID=2213202 RepID=A0A1Q2KYM3_9BACL|nr:signal peptidase I [Planococcus lenghuensis]AQQ53289.1 signal peptidase I [Planococcus lenghuensis]